MAPGAPTAAMSGLVAAACRRPARIRRLSGPAGGRPRARRAAPAAVLGTGGAAGRPARRFRRRRRRRAVLAGEQPAAPVLPWRPGVRAGLPWSRSRTESARCGIAAGGRDGPRRAMVGPLPRRRRVPLLTAGGTRRGMRGRRRLQEGIQAQPSRAGGPGAGRRRRNTHPGPNLAVKPIQHPRRRPSDRSAEPGRPPALGEAILRPGCRTRSRRFRAYLLQIYHEAATAKGGVRPRRPSRDEWLFQVARRSLAGRPVAPGACAPPPSAWMADVCPASAPSAERSGIPGPDGPTPASA